MKLLPAVWRRHFLIFELVVAALIGCTFFYVCRFQGFEAQVEKVLSGNRSNIFGTATSVFGSLLGFVITVTSIVIGFHESERLKIIRESTQYQTLWRVFSSTNWALAVATFLAFLCLVFDKDGPPSFFFYAFVLSSLLAIFRLLRSLWVLEHVIRLITRKPAGN
jgi:hypothetical protein